MPSSWLQSTPSGTRKTAFACDPEPSQVAIAAPGKPLALREADLERRGFKAERHPRAPACSALGAGPQACLHIREGARQLGGRGPAHGVRGEAALDDLREGPVQVGAQACQRHERHAASAAPAPSASRAATRPSNPAKIRTRQLVKTQAIFDLEVDRLGPPRGQSLIWAHQCT